MNDKKEFRWNWIRGMYLYTFFGAGASGAAVIVAPETVQTLLQLQPQDPIVFGIAGSVWLTFGILSFFGLRDPIRFLPVLLFQLIYKTVWLTCVAIPLIVSGTSPVIAILFAAIMTSYIVGDLVAIPFSYVVSGLSSGSVQK